MSQELPKAYDPHSVEQRIYAEWERSGVFSPRGEGEPYCVVLPPPNVTGILHMGHALDHSIQDAVVRRRRMQGYRTLWLPGTDHAGIATQNVVEREIAKHEGKTRQDLGRDEFVKRIWEWREKSGGTITQQMRRLGNSVDWSRERFTMDPDLSRAVRKVFVDLYGEGLIYRGNRIINWCPRCQTALSDIEVEHSDVEGELIHINYPLTDHSGFITVATTRVETMLGDTGVAVNPTDVRYQRLVGKTVVLPIVGREIPIVADMAVDPAFGSGAVKVTPAHDANDFEIAQRAGLEAINVLAPDATINSNGGTFEGMDRYAARKAVLEELRALGAVKKEERPYIHAVGHCQRCHTEVEPWLSEQWFVRIEPLAKPAIEAVRDGRTHYVPRRYERVYLNWMENLRDWCISRQLWWGHRIPVFTCAQGHAFAAIEDPAVCADCGSTELTQDPDVLDTWFSSALWPFSTLGWPDETEDLKTYYPTSVLVTGYDIITFWVSRMMMMGLHFMHDVPFRDVHIHGMVRDFRGKKMSKSFGNAMDPLELIERYGADALRMTLLRSATLGSDVPIAEKWIEGDRNFANKLWNISRFVLMNLESHRPDEASESEAMDAAIDEAMRPAVLNSTRMYWSRADRWILSRLDATVASVDEAMESYDLARAAQMLRQFTWSEFADWYVEWSKGALLHGAGEFKDATRAVLTHVLRTILRLLHPIMPFITEELHRALTGETTIMTAPWPQPDPAMQDRDAETEMEFVMGVVGALRRFRADHKIAHSAKPEAHAEIEDTALAAILESEIERVRALAGWGELAVGSTNGHGGAHARLVVPGAVIHIPLAGLLDLDAERARLQKEIGALEADANGVRRKLANRDFVSKAPEEVVEQQRERLADTERSAERLHEALRDLEG
ncbi:MAG TPA: valine--tRNA ligase [Actinomycetota bacterium]|nr:valine--tRNA ligase [Actinomycetota bacterium]